MPLDMPQLSKKKDKIDRIAFTGPMCSGKSYLAAHLQLQYAYEKVPFAGKLKALAYELFGVEGKDGNNRIILQQLGQKMREIDEDVWVRYALNTVKAREEQNKYFRTVIDDLRYINEEKWLRKNNFTIIRVEADENVRVARMATLYPNADPRAFQHASEHEWKDIKPDHTILNNDFEAIFELDHIIEHGMRG